MSTCLLENCFLIKKKVFSNSRKYQSDESMPTQNNVTVMVHQESMSSSKTELSV